MKVQRLIGLSVGICLVVMVAGFPYRAAYAAQDNPKSLRLAANVVGSLMYAIGAGVAAVAEKHSSFKIEVLPQGNVIAFPMFTTRECDMLLAANDEAHMAYHGLALYDRMTKGKACPCVCS